MSQPRPTSRVRRVPAYWADQETTVESEAAGTEIPAVDEEAATHEELAGAGEPAEVAALEAAEPQLEALPQIPTRRARGAANVQAEEAATEEAGPVQPPGKRGANLPKKGSKQGNAAAATAMAQTVYDEGASDRSRSGRTTGRQAAAASRRGSNNTLVPIAIGIGCGALLGLLIIGILITTRNKPTANPPAASVPTSQVSDVGGAAATDALQAVPTDVGAATDITPTQPIISAAEQSATPSGIFDTGQVSAARGRFDLPRGITLDSQGNYFVTDTQNERVEKFDPAGKFLAMFGGRGSDEGLFNPMSDDSVGTGPTGLATDSAGNVYVADTWNHRVQKFDKDGKFVVAWGGFITLNDPDSLKDPQVDSKFWGPRGIAVGPDGNVYVTDTGNKRVLIFDTNGKFVRKIDSGMSKEKVDANYPFNKPGELNEPIGLAVDGAGNVYVADTRNNRVQKFDKDGKPTAQWAVPSGVWDPGPYLEPYLALDGAGNVYATAPTGKSVIKFGPDGKVLGQKSKEGGVSLQTPTGIAAKSDGTLYVVDTAASAVINFGKMP